MTKMAQEGRKFELYGKDDGKEEWWGGEGGGEEGGEGGVDGRFIVKRAQETELQFPIPECGFNSFAIQQQQCRKSFLCKQ